MNTASIRFPVQAAISALVLAFAYSSPSAAAARSGNFAPKAASPRPMAPFNTAAIRKPPQSITPPVTASKPPSLSRAFYVARDGYPRNGGFAAGTGRVKTLQPGAIIGRKGGGDGRYATKTWAPAKGSLGLEPKADRQPMQYWKVRRPLDVVSGKAAPAWGAPGGANQLVLPSGVNTLSANGHVARTIAPNFNLSAKRR